VEIASGNLVEAQKHFAGALEELRRYPAPLEAWKTYAELGRLKLRLGDASSAHEAFAQAAEIINSIAANVSEQNLRETFLRSDAVKEVLQQ
jgi:hypothetical protein